MTFESLIKADIRMVEMALEGQDEALINMACYHCQQAIEKLFSYSCQLNGIKTIRTHNLIVWRDYLNEKRVYFPSELETHLGKVSRWEGESRYNINFIAARTEVEEILSYCKLWLEKLISPKVARMKSF